MYQKPAPLAVKAISTLGALMICALLSMLSPWTASAGVITTAPFEDPLGGRKLDDIIEEIIKFLLGLAAILVLLALVVGGTRMIFGGFGDEQEARRAKQIIFWAIAGFAIVVLALTILFTLELILT